jgi:hypothetical protein
LLRPVDLQSMGRGRERGIPEADSIGAARQRRAWRCVGTRRRCRPTCLRHSQGARLLSPRRNGLQPSVDSRRQPDGEG